MGQSTNAILFWGYTWVDEETSKPWEIGNESEDGETDDEDDDWEARYAATQGLREPVNADYTHPKWRDYWNEKRRLSAESGCLIDTHCSGDCPMPYVAIRTSHAVALRGDPNDLADDHMTVKPEWREQIDNFCRVMGIPIPQTAPRWYLVSDWN